MNIMASAGLQANPVRAVTRLATPRLTVSVVPAGSKPVLLRPRARFAHTGRMGLLTGLFSGNRSRVAGGKVLARCAWVIWVCHAHPSSA